jgi:GWxTD domain-containing protein
MDSLRSATGDARRDLWERFWTRRDPIPATPLNEYREEFFNRVRFATEHFAEPGRQGWDTSRGEVYIVLGPPGDVTDKQFGRDGGEQGNALEWYYYTLATGRLHLTFVERGAGHFELTPESESSYRAAAMRAKPRGK